MGMFMDLFELARDATLTLVIDADAKANRMTINLVPRPKKDCGEAALSKDLSLTATPQEFDAEFLQLLQGYREQRRSLQEQAQATADVLAAAKKGAGTVAKARKNASGQTTPTSGTPAPDDPESGEDADDAGACADATGTASDSTGAASDDEPQLFG